MKAVLVSKENTEVKFTVEFTAEEFEDAVQKTYLKNRSRITVDGFRKGKAPRSIIEKKYGEGIFFEEAINDMLDASYPTALDELKIDPIDRPNCEFGEEKIEKGKGFTVTFTVHEAPVIEAKDYKDIAVEVEKKKVTDADVEAELMAAQKKNSRMVVVDRAAENGDTVLLDYAGFVGEEQFEGGTAENQTLKLGSNTFIPGFEDQLVGVKAGESRDVKVTFPEEYHAENLAGKEAVFKCTVHDVKTEEFPEINDSFAMDVSEFDTLAEFKEDIKKRLTEDAEKAFEYDAKNAVLDKVYEANPVEAPKSMIDDEVELMVNEMEQNLSYNGLTLDTYCKYFGQTVEAFKETQVPEATKRVNSRIILASIAQAEGIEASEEDLAKEYEDMAKQYNMDVDQVKKYVSPVQLSKDVVARKTIDFVYGSAKVKAVAEKKAKKATEKKETKKAAEKKTE